MSPAKSVDLGIGSMATGHGGGALTRGFSACQAALELPAKPYLISCLDRSGKRGEREASVPYKGKPNLVTGDWNRFWNAAHNGGAALWSQTFSCLIK